MASVAEMVLPPGDEILVAGGVSFRAEKPVNPSCHPEWDALVKTYPDYSFFHSAAWARTLENAYGYKPVYLTANKREGICSVLPLMEVNSWLTGSRAIALPFTDECGVLYRDSVSAKYLVQSAFELGKSRGWKSVEFRGNRELFPDVPVSLSFYGHTLNLDKDEDLLFTRLDGSVRQAIRKAEKRGVSMAISQGMDGMNIFYSLQCQTRRNHGLPPQPFSFFRNIYQHILSKNLGMIIIASYQKRPIAAAVYFQLGVRAVYKYGASDKSFQQLRGSNLVMWQAIKQLAQAGAKTLHLGRTAIGNEGLRRFKLGWGAQEHKIDYFKYDLRRGAFITESDATTGWHNRVFRVLPSGLSRIVGKALYRHVA
jgi:Acetyltransferase (GNAT) domain